MALMDVFKADAFSIMSLLAAIKNVDYKPSFLGSLGLFQDAPQRTRTVAIESDDETLALISTSQVGAPPSQLSATKRKVRNFSTVRLAKASTIKAEELQGIRAFGSESEMQQVQAEVARRPWDRDRHGHESRHAVGTQHPARSPLADRGSGHWPGSGRAAGVRATREAFRQAARRTAGRLPSRPPLIGADGTASP